MATLLRVLGSVGLVGFLHRSLAPLRWLVLCFLVALLADLVEAIRRPGIASARIVGILRCPAPPAVLSASSRATLSRACSGS